VIFGDAQRELRRRKGCAGNEECGETEKHGSACGRFYRQAKPGGDCLK